MPATTLPPTPVAAWGDRTTPFQLDGQAPVERRPPDGRLWDYAGQELGFYGWLRTAHTRVLRRIGLGLLDLSDRRWRDSYVARQHPYEAADAAIADEAAAMGCEL